MTDDVRLCLLPGGADTGDAVVRAEPSLLADGWMRRSVVDVRRARELHDLYTRLGFEVLLHELQPSDFASACGQCAETACGAYVLIYVRKSRDSGAADVPGATDRRQQKE